MATIYADTNADAVGTVAGTFNISASNNKLDITIDGGSTQHFTLTNGSARTAAQVVADLSALTGATASVFGLLVRITTTSNLGASSSIVIGTPSNNANSTLGMSGTYTGFPWVNTTFTGATKQNIIDGIETALLAAGWTTVSGHGTTSLLMQSALSPSPQNLQMRLRVKDNGGTCANITIENVAGTKTFTSGSNNGAPLNPGAAKTFRVIANKYQAFVFTASTNTSREFAAFGVVALPTDLQGVITEGIWLHGNAQNDTDTTLRDSFRNSLQVDNGLSGQNPANQAAILNAATMEFANNSFTPSGGSTSFAASMALQTVAGGRTGTGNGGLVPGMFKWHDGAVFIIDAIIGWGMTASNDERVGRGQVWNGIVVADSFTADGTTTYDGHTYFVITASNTGGTTSLRGTLMIAVA